MKRLCALLCALTLLPAAATQALAADAQVQATPAVEVYTDYSAYRPYTPPKASYTRLRPGPLPEFVPSEDYGAVYPYVASFLHVSSHSWLRGARYGFVDENGCILTDDAYAEIEPMTQDAYPYGDYIEEVYLPFWVTMQVTDPVIRYAEDGNGYWREWDRLYGVVSADGRFALPCVYTGIRCVGDSFLCFQRGQKPWFTVYDRQGQVRFTSDVLFGSEEAPQDWELEYGDGLYLLSERSSGRTYRCWFVDLEGNRLLGPYVDARPFSGGLAPVSEDGVSYGVIDKSGAWAYAPVLGPLSIFQNGVAFLTRGGESFLRQTPDGGVIRQFCSAYTSYEEEPCGFSLEYGTSYQGANNIRYFYAPDGTLLYQGGVRAACIDAETFFDRDGESCRVFRLTGEELCFPSKKGYVWTSIDVQDGEVRQGYLCRDLDAASLQEKEYFIPPDLSGRHEIKSVSAPVPIRGTHYWARNELTNEGWYLCWDGRAWHCRSESGQLVTVPLRAELTLRGERIMALTDTTCSYYDLDGRLLFCLPISPGD